MRTPIIAGNWKCHKTTKEAAELTREILAQLGAIRDIEVVLCPPFTALSVVAQILIGDRAGTLPAGDRAGAIPAGKGVSAAAGLPTEEVPQRQRAAALGAQDLFWEPQGAFTGEVSPVMLKDVGCRYVIIGHSERRRYFGETDQTVQRKLASALRHGLIPIVCIGETLEEREQHQTYDVLKRQLGGALDVCAPSDVGRIVVAYEPVWAIGTGRNATPEQAQEAHRFIRNWLGERFGIQAAESVRLQYGGSVAAANAASLLQQADVDGALVGGASLNADAFATIVKAAIDAKAVTKP